MKEELFDRRVRDLINACSETPPQDVWERIESGLERRRKRVVWKRLAYGAAAAAVAAGLFTVTMMRPDTSGQLQPVRLADLSYVPSLNESAVIRTEALPPLRKRVMEDSEVEVHGTAAETEESVPSREDGIPAADVSGNVDDAGDAVPYVNDRTVRTGYPVVSDVGTDDLSGDELDSRRKKPSFSLSASGNLSPTRATGNVDFSQPNYSWGAGGTSSSTGIVPVSEPRHYFPVSVGLELKYSFLNDRLGVGLGVNYAFLYSRYEALVDRQYQATVDQSVHYLGVPLNFYVNILSGDRFQFYADAGCMMERAVKVSYEITDLYSVKYQQDGSAQGLQWSVNVGLGLEYRFLNFMGVYVDPRLTYFFDCGQPYSVRTEQPLQFNLQMGFRFHI